MATKPKAAVLPRDWRDPAGVDALERRAMRDMSARLRRVGKVYREALGRIPAEPTVNRRYTFQLVPTLLKSLLAQLDIEIATIFLEGGEDGLWFSRLYVEVAARRGAAQAFANLAQQSPAYKSGRGSLQELLGSEPFLRRMALVRARAFEEMKGLSQQVTAGMSRVLTEGIGRGLNPREIASNLTAQTGIEEVRAHRIARTEIPMALRRARWDETEEAKEEFGLRTLEMHLSALSPTTRASHAARHAKLFTIEQVRDWWSEGANAINCKCSTASVLVDKNGKPLVDIAIEHAKKAKRAMEARGYAWAKE